jgi:ribosomal protein S27AE
MDGYISEDCISRESIKQKLQEHHDFFVNAYGGFSNLPRNDKSRVDEITNCIAMVVNEPPVTPQQKVGKWIAKTMQSGCGVIFYNVECSECGESSGLSHTSAKYCPNCGAKMED